MSVQLRVSVLLDPSLQLPDPSQTCSVQDRDWLAALEKQLMPLQTVQNPQSSGAQVTPAETFE